MVKSGLIKLTSLAATFIGNPSICEPQALIRVASDTKIGAIQEVRLNGELEGFASDIIELAAGEFDLVLKIESSYYVTVSGVSNRSNVDFDEAQFETGTCDFGPILTTEDPVLINSTASPSEPITNIKVEFGNVIDTGISSGCSYLMLGPIERAAVVNFVSTPPGAEIWVDGRKLTYQTDVSLSIPFKKYDEDQPYMPLDVLIRKGGFVNQRFEVDLSSRSVTANLEQPEEWAARVLDGENRNSH